MTLFRKMTSFSEIFINEDSEICSQKRTKTIVNQDQGLFSRKTYLKVPINMGLLKSKSKTSNIGLSVADFFWSSCVVAPLVVAYWRGTWDLLEDWVRTASNILQTHFKTLIIYLQVYPDPDPDKEYVTNSLKSDNEVSEESPVTVMSWYRQLTGITCYLLGIIVRIGLDLAL